MYSTLQTIPKNINTKTTVNCGNLFFYLLGVALKKLQLCMYTIFDNKGLDLADRPHFAVARRSTHGKAIGVANILEGPSHHDVSQVCRIRF